MSVARFGFFNSPGRLMLDTHKNSGLAVVPLNHGDGSPHVLFEPIDVGAVL